MSEPANAYEDLKQRGFVYQVTDEVGILRALAGGPVTFYIGFDPTADSLHVGHLLPVMAMRRMQKFGHRPIAVVGGGTALVGDPSGKTEARPILSQEQVEANAAAIRRQLERFLDFGEERALLLNNADWLAPLRYIEFLRDIGRHFSVNRMLAAESVRSRLETGLSFLEFNYMLLQAYDFYVLCRDYDCILQMGGQDQWGNIVAGIDLIRRLLGREAFGVTFPLLLKSDGEKFGKTAGGAVWLDPRRTSTFDYYQFWRNAADADVTRLLAFFTDLPMDEVRRLGSLTPPEINRAKEILAFEATCLAHGETEAARVYLAAGRQFGFADPDGKIATSSRIRFVRPETAGTADIPTVTMEETELRDGIWIAHLLVKAGLTASTSEARRLVRGGGAYLNDRRITDEQYKVTTADLADGELRVRSGKKKIRRIVAR